MKIASQVPALAAVVLIFTYNAAISGKYHHVADQVEAGNIVPYAIAHPAGYDGSGGVVAVDICIEHTFPDSYKLVGALQAAIETWNDLTPMTGNCEGCVLWEEEARATGQGDVESVILHELGHCAMGLGHINLGGLPYGPTSFTESVGAVEIIDGNALRGDAEDDHQPPVQVHDMAWFRKGDNNPVVVDSTVIDQNTFSRSVVADLPAEDYYAANANRAVAEALGFPNTQAVMYSAFDVGTRFSGLTADDVNMVLMGMTGADLVSGTADDYTIHLRYRAKCDGDHEIRVGLFPLGQGTPGACYSSIETSFPQGVLKFHWTLIPVSGTSDIQIEIDQRDWDYGERLFSSGFENGEFAEWSSVVP